MPSATITLRVVSNHLPEAQALVHQALVETVAETAFDVEARAKVLCPVDTGTLRRSIHTVFSNGGLKALVGPSVAYSIYVEFGTRFMAARPYMRPAAALVLRMLPGRFSARLRRLAA
jgi:HK97 gp10 family phage protein